MGAATEHVRLQRGCSPFDLDDEASYRRWRAVKLGTQTRRADDLIVDVADPSALSVAERAALLQRCARWNMAIYRCARSGADKALARSVGAQLGLHRLDANWLADEDGVSSIAVSRPLPPSALRAVPPEGERAAWDGPAPRRDERGGFIPYTDKPIRWHTDGYYNPPPRRIRAMILHCVRPAASGGVNALLDHELAYIALRDASPRWMRALMADDAMVVPGRDDETGVARAAQAGPVFSVDAHDGTLHMRYTARTRSIEWKADPATREAAAFLERLLSDDNANVLRVRLDAGMGLVANNVLHDRSGFHDDPAAPRLFYRARYLERIATPEAPWPNG